MAFKFVTYYRVSTQAQGESGLGLEAQKRDVELYLQNYAEDSHEVIGEYVEVHSGLNNEREELQQAIILAKKEGAVLLVAKLDRLSRKVSFIASLMDDKNLQIKVAQMPHADKFQLHIYAALAEQERDFISKRTKAALAEAKARGVKLGGLRDKTNQRNKAIKRNADQFAKKFRDIIHPMREQGMSFAKIADALNGMGMQTARGGQFTATAVQRINTRLVYAI